MNSYLKNSSCTLIVAPAGARHLAHSRVAALEKGHIYKTMAIPCELRLAVLFNKAGQMTNSHSQPLYVTLH